MPTVKLTDALLRKRQAELPEGQRERLWDERTTGFGAIVGRRFVSFVVQTRLNGEQALRTIGRLDKPGPDGTLWTEPRARKAALKMLGAMASGEDPDGP